MVDRDVELLSAVAEVFIECRLEQIDWLDRALRANDLVDAHHAAHQLRGSLMSVGARQAATIAHELERAARADRLAGREAQLSELRDRLERIADELVALVATAAVAARVEHCRVPA